uniref:Uncharacterized protein LOC104235442 n=1 Tax=Nicotiana sylvestris TaxID=4096 RepID=A0A1U7X9I3_NICSY
KFIKEDVPIPPDETPDNEHFLVTEAWKHSDFLCKDYILSGLEDDLIFIEGLVINEEFQVTVVIEKLSPLWKDFKNHLKHKHKEMSLEDLIVRKKEEGFYTEKKPSKKRFNRNCYNCGKAGHKSVDCRTTKKDKKKGKTNMVEKYEDIDDLEAFAAYAPVEETLSMGNSATAKIEGCGTIFLKMTSSKVVTLNNVLHISEIRKNLVSIALLVKNGFKCVFVFDKKKEEGFYTEKKPSKKRFNRNCYNCGKAGHKSVDCHTTKKDKKKGKTNMVEKYEDIDDLEAFAAYAPVEETLSMGNSATAKIEGCGTIFLKMTSSKVVTLNNVLHIFEIRKNLVSIALLVKNGFKCVFVFDK